MIPGMTICSAVQLRQSQSEEKWSGFTYFNASGDHFAKHQSERTATILEEEGAGGRRCREHGILLESLSDLRSSLADHLSTVLRPCHEALSFPHRYSPDPRPDSWGRLCRP